MSTITYLPYVVLTTRDIMFLRNFDMDTNKSFSNKEALSLFHWTVFTRVHFFIDNGN